MKVTETKSCPSQLTWYWIWCDEEFQNNSVILWFNPIDSELTMKRLYSLIGWNITGVKTNISLLWSLEVFSYEILVESEKYIWKLSKPCEGMCYCANRLAEDWYFLHSIYRFDTFLNCLIWLLRKKNHFENFLCDAYVNIKQNRSVLSNNIGIFRGLCVCAHTRAHVCA